MIIVIPQLSEKVWQNSQEKEHTVLLNSFQSGPELGLNLSKTQIEPARRDMRFFSVWQRRRHVVDQEAAVVQLHFRQIDHRRKCAQVLRFRWRVISMDLDIQAFLFNNAKPANTAITYSRQ